MNNDEQNSKQNSPEYVIGIKPPLVSTPTVTVSPGLIFFLLAV